MSRRPGGCGAFSDAPSGLAYQVNPFRRLAPPATIHRPFGAITTSSQLSRSDGDNRLDSAPEGTGTRRAMNAL